MRYSTYIYPLLVMLTGAAAYYLISINNVETVEGEMQFSSMETYKGYDASQFQPLPIDLVQPANKVSLGKRLFKDKRLSHDNTTSCETCHNLSRDGADRLPTSVGIGGARGNLNAPTVFNSGFNFKQFWDGRADNLEEQAAGPVHNPVEMGSDWQEVIAKLSNDTDYQAAFHEIYPKGITPDTIVDAIATFERTLITPDSRFDQYLRGDSDVLTADEQTGFQLFKEYGCASCHQGINLGGNMFQKFGVIKGYFDDRSLNKEDFGRFNVTGLEEDRHVFKVPGLRNVAVTTPYFHDGSVNDLDVVVLSMGRYQLGRELSSEEVRLITAFLKTLTGKWEGKTLQ
ncbi:MAG: cytochrome-c peroxidase [gamma proteobacterium symbiont of Bathyaustriella thionipta]|nr:cytochrome-c peroxidase [gamma proteobacterium symbiont of Bathyaustriella thionipta]MCU7948770.1 cytochrome-c peroxidase [gamma proteobacterium symbiont of Bathyaustriella thionipta]MCU7954993.1 cytochrome-c peroxidase [gamma proteobacterium symbiont of Bathyaustriella thionipta]MCU7955321.1 cytochrome-c peroxidase [gamma proteobacterium symbiont of Bathyaustriella thionipta]MCU7967062.1 cytochrome-c peroxidase [gamma proteobacterium symbiont of Bathyaustriella thionipta]